MQAIQRCVARFDRSLRMRILRGGVRPLSLDRGLGIAEEERAENRVHLAWRPR
jgi:hypothetical protein